MKKIIFLFLFLAALLPSTSLAQTKLTVPYILQVTNHKWIQPWADACEESSITMVKYFFAGKNKISTKEANEQLEKLFKIENEHFGFNKDTNAEQTAELINLFLPYEAEVHSNPNLEEIKKEINQNHPVIALVYGKDLKNKYFLNGGPDYHILVISGYDDANKNFIVQDPGFRRGQNFLYNYSLLLNAIHDFLPNKQTKNGEKKIIFTSPQITWSGSTDGDNDGLNKYEEINYGTDLTNADTDNDGFPDGLEVKNGYSPLVAESKIPSYSLIKTQQDNKIFLLVDSYKRYIPDLVTLKKYGKGKKIYTVSEKFINNLSRKQDLN